MISEAYNKWTDLYDESLLEIWEKEQNELKQISMLLHVLKREFHRVQSKLDLELSHIKNSLHEKERLILNASPNKQSKENVKPSLSLKKEPLAEIVDVSDKARFNSSSSSFCCNSSSEKEEILSTSPTINKNKKLSFLKKKKSNVCAKVPINDNETMLSQSCLKPVSKISVNLANAEFKTPEPTMVNKIFDKEVINAVEGSEDIFECSIIENTPEVSKSKSLKLSKYSSISLKSKVKKKSKNSKSDSKRKGGGTLTQMLKSLNDKESEAKKQQRVSDTQSTFFCNSLIKEDHMDIDDILLVANNTQGGSKNESEVNQPLVGNNDTTYFDEGVPNRFVVSQKFIDEYDKLPEIKPEPTVNPYKEVVRGKAKLQLPGWSCRKCEDFYKAFNLPPEELQKKMDACSKHRSKFKPPEDTFSGFWDMTLPPTPK